MRQSPAERPHSRLISGNRRRVQAMLAGLVLLIGCAVGTPTPAGATPSQPGEDREAPIVRMSLVPSGPVEPGTALDLRVEVLVPTWFLDAPRFPESLELDGATVELQRGSAENLSETIAGSTWAGLRRHYHIRPLNPGEFRLPALEVGVHYARAGGGQPLERSVRGELKAPFRVRVPAAAAELDPFIGAHQLQLMQRIERPAGTLGVGDALRRSIVLETDAAMVELPDGIWLDMPGAQLYLDPPRSHETRSDAAARALVREERSATWVFERPGVYELPAVSLQWWDLSARRLRRTELPALSLTVGPQRRSTVFALPEALAGIAAGDEALRELARPITLGLAVSALAWLGWRRRELGRKALAFIRTRWQATHRSEWWLFVRLVLACRRNDGPASCSALQRWLDACSGCPPTPSGWLLERVPSAALGAALLELDTTLYGRGTHPRWRGAALSRQLLRARWRVRRQRRAKAARLTLTLNP